MSAYSPRNASYCSLADPTARVSRAPGSFGSTSMLGKTVRRASPRQWPDQMNDALQDARAPLSTATTRPGGRDLEKPTCCRYFLTACENPAIAAYTKPRKCGLLSLWQVSQVLEVGTFLMPVRTVASAACRLPGP